ncbi:MAG: RT0821/Lpp0805 family surface protein [Alphaproteobacteria bacterium]
MRRIPALTLLAASLLLAACQSSKTYSPPPPPNTAVLAPATVAPPAKTAAPTGETDRLKDEQARKRATTASIGQQITWNNPDSGNSGTITPIRDFYSDSGVYCREFQQTHTTGGQQQKTRITACQQPDGGWK